MTSLKLVGLLSFLLIFNHTISVVSLPSHTPEEQFRSNAKSYSEITDCSDPDSSLHRRDGIDSVDDPKFISVKKADRDIPDDDLVLGLDINGHMRAYPHNILRYHEIVNDFTQQTPMGVTYCPITGSGLGFNLNQLEGSTIGVTGILMESNQVFYDRKTDSCFSQMLAFGLSGERLGQKLEITPIIQTTWLTWKTLYPDSEVLSRDIRNYADERYDQNGYSEYQTSNSLMYPVEWLEKEPYNLYHPKEHTLVLASEDSTYLFTHEELVKQPVSNVRIGYQNVSIVYDKFNSIAVPFQTTINSTYSLELTWLENFTEYPRELSHGLFMFHDQLGNIYNMKGEVVMGSHTGSVLNQYPSYTAYWYAAIVFFPNAFIYQQNTSITYNINPDYYNIYNPADLVSKTLIIISGFTGTVALVVFILYLRRKRTSKTD